MWYFLELSIYRKNCHVFNLTCYLYIFFSLRKFSGSILLKIRLMIDTEVWPCLNGPHQIFYLYWYLNCIAGSLFCLESNCGWEKFCQWKNISREKVWHYCDIFHEASWVSFMLFLPPYYLRDHFKHINLDTQHTKQGFLIIESCSLWFLEIPEARDLSLSCSLVMAFVILRIFLTAFFELVRLCFSPLLITCHRLIWCCY